MARENSWKQIAVKERKARERAEQELEKRSQELYIANQKLMRLNSSLETKVVERNETLMALITNLQAGVLVEDAKRKVLLVNEEFCKIFKLPPPEGMIGADCSESAEYSKTLFKEPERFVQDLDVLLKNRQTVVGQELQMTDGRILERDYIPIYSQGKYMGHLWQYRDITEKKKKELELRRSEEKYKSIIENMELGLMEVDIDGNIMHAYDRFCEMTGYRAEELIGKNAMKTFLPSEFLPVLEEHEHGRRQGKASVYEIQMFKKNGDRIWALISGAPFYGEKGIIEGSIGIHLDITDRKLLEEQLIKAKKAADDASKAEKEFLASISHEIRNPINSVIGMTHLLYDTELHPEQREYLDAIKYSSDLLQSLISDVLDISKIQAGEVEFSPSEFSLPEIIQGIVKTYQFRLQEKEISVLAFLDPKLRTNVIGDKTMLNQVLNNLFSNAAKFTESGEITIKVDILDRIDDEINVRFRVRDSGIGIPEEKLQLIFESFKQAERDTKLKYGGTGLGLSITKRLVEIHGGQITVESEVGEGSTFTCIIPFKDSGKSTRPVAQKKTPITGAFGFNRLLVVDDNRMNQLYLSGILKKWKINFDVASNGQEAVQMVEREAYDLILMDIRMPIMDGYEATIKIRNMGQNVNCKTPIIALTASALVDERAKALLVGMNYHLTKPFVPAQLEEALRQFSLIEVEAPEEEENDFAFNSELDAETLNMFYGGDMEYALEMFRIFAKNTPQEIQYIRDFLELTDVESLVKAIHKMKPNFGMIGMPNLELETNLLELELQKTQSLDPNLCDRVCRFLDNVENKLKIIHSEIQRMEEIVV